MCTGYEDSMSMEIRGVLWFEGVGKGVYVREVLDFTWGRRVLGVQTKFLVPVVFRKTRSSTSTKEGGLGERGNWDCPLVPQNKKIKM